MLPSPLPTPELRDLGVKLQQAVVLTRIRAEQLPACRVKARATRVVENADKMFTHLSAVAQATSAFAGFLGRAMGISIDDLFMYTGKPKIARGVAYAGVSAVNEAVKDTINELAAVNAAIDKEVSRHGNAQH
jgi:hypothetical protein